MGEIKKFWNQHPVLTVVFGISGLFIADKTLKAFKAGSGDFWSIGGTTSTSTTTSSSHRTTPSHSEPMIDIPLQFHGTSNYVNNDDEVSINGLPGALKRRVGHGKLSSGSDDYVPVNPSMPDVTTPSSVMGDNGGINQVGSMGWM
jgi:hypothetical protein